MSEETHYACDEELKKYGAQTLCCACNEHNCIETSVRLDLLAPKKPTPTQSDWERRKEIKEVVDMVVLKCNENIGQLTHICSAIEHLAEKQYKAGLATSQQETLERVVGEVSRLITPKSYETPDACSGTLFAIENKLIALQETITPPK